MTKRTLADGSPVYDSWDEALADPDLDLSRPWHIAYEPDPSGGKAVQLLPEWPPGWVEIGATTKQPEEPMTYAHDLPALNSWDGDETRARWHLAQAEKLTGQASLGDEWTLLLAENHTRIGHGYAALAALPVREDS